MSKTKSTKLPWPEKVPILSIHPDAASRDDIAKLATELMEANHQLDKLKESISQCHQAYHKTSVYHHKRIQELEAIPRCPCSGELEGLGYDKRTKEIVFECKKCHTQLLLSSDIWEQALKGK